MKALMILMLTILAINVSYAGYGEDMKGECVKGKNSGRDQQEVVVEDSSAQSEVKEATSKSK